MPGRSVKERTVGYSGDKVNTNLEDHSESELACVYEFHVSLCRQFANGVRRHAWKHLSGHSRVHINDGSDWVFWIWLRLDPSNEGVMQTQNVDFLFVR